MAGRKTPDDPYARLFCSAVNGNSVLIDCRPVSKSDEDFRKKCSVTEAVCEEAGWDYRVVGEPDLLGYLLAEPEFEALEVAPRRVPQDARLATLDEAEQDRVRWLEGHILELESGRHPERPAREAYDPDLHSVDEREKAKLAELEQAGFAMTQRSLKRLRSAYLEEGLLGLADTRKLRRIAPNGRVDPRVITAMESMLGDPRGRSTVARTVMFRELPPAR